MNVLNARNVSSHFWAIFKGQKKKCFWVHIQYNRHIGRACSGYRIRNHFALTSAHGFSRKEALVAISFGHTPKWHRPSICLASYRSLVDITHTLYLILSTIGFKILVHITKRSLYTFSYIIWSYNHSSQPSVQRFRESSRF